MHISLNILESKPAVHKVLPEDFPHIPENIIPVDKYAPIVSILIIVGTVDYEQVTREVKMSF
jgi:hypothetical protein